MLDITVVDIRAAVQIGTTRLTYHLGYLSKKKKKKNVSSWVTLRLCVCTAGMLKGMVSLIRTCHH